MAHPGLDDLNEAQRAAVLAPDGPILILAGAGSGKTRVLAYRIAHLMGEREVAPGRTLAVTFTNKAAREMRERIAALLGGEFGMPRVSTFHSACAGILRHEARSLGYERNFTILDEADSLGLIRSLVGESALAACPPPEAVRARIEQAKNEALMPDEFEANAKGEIERVVAGFYRLYQERLRQMNAMDFGDLLLLTYRLFQTNPEVLSRWQLRAEQLLVDEYQDTNRVQYLIARALSARTQNLCVVGDEDQSIYRWRGADIRNILDFERDFPSARIFKLEQNYRSTKTILAAAHAVISHNRERKEKRLWTENSGGEPVTWYTGATEREEADFIAREIARLVREEGLAFSEAVVFYRVNAQSRVIEEALLRRRVPYAVVGGLRFYEHREVKDLLAYLRLVANPADAVSLERIIGTPARGIGEKTVETIRRIAAERGISAFEALGRLETESGVPLRAAKSAGALYAWLGELSAKAAAMKVRAVLDAIVAATDFTAYLDGLSDGPARRQNLSEMLAATSAFDAEPEGGGLIGFLERVALLSDADQVGQEGGRITLMTLHTSKGLEYPVVFIAGMEEGLFPHSRSSEDGRELEEERRLCYVGMTRARRLLYLTNTLARELYGQRSEARPSRFLAEVPHELTRRLAPETRARPLVHPSGEPYIDYTESQLPENEAPTDGLAVGATVIHHNFGRGVVRRREGRGETAKAWVHFERGGLKLLMLKYANLRTVAW